MCNLELSLSYNAQACFWFGFTFLQISLPCWDHLNKLTQQVTEFQGEQVSVSGCSSGPVSISGCKQAWGRWDITFLCSLELGEPGQCPCCSSHTTAASVLFYGCGECLFVSGTWHLLFLFQGVLCSPFIPSSLSLTVTSLESRFLSLQYIALSSTFHNLHLCCLFTCFLISWKCHESSSLACYCRISGPGKVHGRKINNSQH